MLGFGFRVEVFRVLGFWVRVQGSGFRVQGSGFRVQGSGLRVWVSCDDKMKVARVQAVQVSRWQAAAWPVSCRYWRILFFSALKPRVV